MMLLIKTDQHYPHRPLPPAPYLLDEPRSATAALEAAIRACPKNKFTSKYPRPTYTQRYEFDATTATQVLTQLQHIIAHRKTSGVALVYHQGRCFFPEFPTPPKP